MRSIFGSKSMVEAVPLLPRLRFLTLVGSAGFEFSQPTFGPIRPTSPVQTFIPYQLGFDTQRVTANSERHWALRCDPIDPGKGLDKSERMPWRAC